MAKAWYKLFTFTSINKVSQFFFFLSVAAEKYIIQKQQQDKSLDRFADRDKKRGSRANRQRGCRSREAAP